MKPYKKGKNPISGEITHFVEVPLLASAGELKRALLVVPDDALIDVLTMDGVKALYWRLEFFERAAAK